MPHVQSFCMALKMSWINKLLDPLNISCWKTLLVDQYTKYGADKIWMLPPHCIHKLQSKFNKFWRDVLLNWSKLSIESTAEPEEILSQPIWFNEHLKINNATVFYKTWCKAGIYFINDLIGENNQFLSPQELNNKYGLSTNFLQFYSVLNMIPKHWKNLIRQTRKLERVTNYNFDFIKQNKKSSQHFYKELISDIGECPLKQQTKWCEQLDTEVDNWEEIYLSLHQCTKNTKLITFQYKILNRILSTNSLLMKCKLKETDLCSFCNETKESILHLFWDCMVVKNLWLEIDSFIQNTCNIYLPLSAKSIILGVDPSGTHLTSLLIVIVKYYIYSCRFRSMTPCFIGAKTFI